MKQTPITTLETRAATDAIGLVHAVRPDMAPDIAALVELVAYSAARNLTTRLEGEGYIVERTTGASTPSPDPLTSAISGLFSGKKVEDMAGPAMDIAMNVLATILAPKTSVKPS